MTANDANERTAAPLRNGERVRVVAMFTEEPELLGMEGDVCWVEETGERIGVFLDNDKMPTTFLKGEVDRVEP